MGKILFTENEIEYCLLDGVEYSEEIRALEQECFKDAWSENNIRSQLEKENSISFGAVLDGKLVGACCLDYLFDEGELLRICVTGSMRGKGIAQNIMKMLMDFTMEHNVENIFLEVRSDNIPAINLYLKNGFKQISVRKKYYGDCDGIIMKCCKMQSN